MTLGQSGEQGASGRTVGWDIGGAHLKAAVVDAGVVVDVVQVPCELWLGLDRLEAAFDAVIERLGRKGTHAITMTGELADLFTSRAEGVRTLTAVAVGRLGSETAVYAGAAGFLAHGEAEAEADAIASANWHATASLAGQLVPEALLVDLGSTTADLIPICGGVPASRGSSDATRLASGELVYTGAVRTPLMALAGQAPVRGRWQGVMAEHFATMSDANRLLGRMADDEDQHGTADGRSKSLEHSRGRLARMVGLDAAEADDAEWAALAAWFAERQLRQLHDAALLAISGSQLPADAPVVACGIGRAAVAELARRLARPLLPLQELIPARAGVGSWTASCAPAVAVARLAALRSTPGL